MIRRIIITSLVFFLAALVFVRFARLHESLEIDPATEPVPVTLPSEFEPLLTQSNRIRTVHEKKRPIQPGDWLDRFPEGGQTFSQYVQLRNRLPLRDVYQTIYVQPLGDFDETQQRLVAQTTEFIGHFFGMPVQLLETRSLGDIPETARRMRNDEEQVLTTWIINDVLKPQRPKDAVAVIGLVTGDLWSGDLNWVFGAASFTERVGVWSLHRNGDPHRGDDAYRLCLRRTLKTAVHETGHMLGIPHCVAFECCMNGSRSREESDRQPLEFCSEC